MKKTLITATILAIIGFHCCLWAQDEVKKDGKTEEIIIRNKGDKEMNLDVKIKGDQITVNGKPLAEFKDDNITINKRKMMVSDGDEAMLFDFGPGGRNFNMDDMMSDGKEDKAITKPFLG